MCFDPGQEVHFLFWLIQENARGNFIGKGVIEAQAKQVFVNLKALVEEAGGQSGRHRQVTIFLVGITPTAYEVVGRVRGNSLVVINQPVSTMVEVNRLVSADWLIEVEA